MTFPEAGKYALDLLYPRRCPVCHRIAPAGKDLCDECISALPYVREPRCRKCGKPVSALEVFCEDCLRHPHVFDQGTAAFAYNDSMRETIRIFKFKGRREYGSVLGRLLAEYAKEELRIWKAEAVIPVPLHAAKLRKRGYNQAEVTGRALAKQAGLPLMTGVLMRAGKTAAMKTLDESERRKNLREAFSVRAGAELPARVLLVDDIYTTGSTMDACAAVLKEAGVREVFAACICIGEGDISVTEQ